MSIVSLDEIRWYRGEWWTGILWYNHSNDVEVWEPVAPVSKKNKEEYNGTD